MLIHNNFDKNQIIKKEELEKKILKYFNVQGSSTIKKEDIKNLLSSENNKECLEIIKDYLKISKKDKSEIKILDFGCGLGGLVLLAENENFKTWGVEIDKEAAEIAKLRVKNPDRIILTDSEKLPFDDESFEVITSKCVIEHVSDLEKYITEVYRVLKKDGIFIIFAPNHLFPWEGHYKTFFIPYLMPYAKKIFKIFLKIKNKNVNYLNYINTRITPLYLIKKIREAGFDKVKNLSYQKFIDRIINPEKIGATKAKKIMFKIKNNKILFYFIIKFSKIFLKLTQLYHPIILLIKK